MRRLEEKTKQRRGLNQKRKKNVVKGGRFCAKRERFIPRFIQPIFSKLERSNFCLFGEFEKKLSRSHKIFSQFSPIVKQHQIIFSFFTFQSFLFHLLPNAALVLCSPSLPYFVDFNFLPYKTSKNSKNVFRKCFF